MVVSPISHVLSFKTLKQGYRDFTFYLLSFLPRVPIDIMSE